MRTKWLYNTDDADWCWLDHESPQCPDACLCVCVCLNQISFIVEAVYLLLYNHWLRVGGWVATAEVVSGSVRAETNDGKKLINARWTKTIKEAVWACCRLARLISHTHSPCMINHFTEHTKEKPWLFLASTICMVLNFKDLDVSACLRDLECSQITFSPWRCQPTKTCLLKR